MQIQARAAAFVAAAVFLAGAPVAVAAPKTDVVVMVNGDRLTGEVKGLERGKLSFKTDATGTIEIEWDKVARLQTTQYVQVELTSGSRHAGRVPTAEADGRLLVKPLKDSPGRDLALADVVRIAPIERGGLTERLDGYVSAGYDYAKSTGIQQLTFSGGLETRDERRQWALDGSSTLTQQREVEDTERFDLSGAYRHFLAGRSFAQGFVTLEGNDELGLDLRTTVGAAYGHFVLQDRVQEWATYGGVALTREDYDTETEENVEAVLGTQYWLFVYDSPEASLDARLNVFPSLTDFGRIRSDGRLRARIELVSDLFWELSLYGTYDTDPGDEARSPSDYGVVTSLGYTF